MKILIGILFLGFALAGYAQYTASDLERKKAENLYPEPGPGDLLIVDQLKVAILELQEQKGLLAEQNRILLQTLEELKKQNTTKDQ
jgi:hypothetical protein